MGAGVHGRKKREEKVGGKEERKKLASYKAEQVASKTAFCAHLYIWRF